jgi:predicted NBD/HSP70 family sugar kinase
MRLEEVASSDNIVRRTRDRFHQDNTSSLNKLDEQAIRIDDILTAAAAEDDFARLMLERTGNYIGTAVASVINLLNIETIVIGGPTMAAGNVLLNAIIRSARELSFAPSFESTLILASELGERAAAIGAALLTLNE